MVKKYILEWKKGFTERYYIIGTGREVQLGKYRGADNFEKSINKKYKWHGKWYVDDMKNKVKLFDTQKEAKDYLIKLRNKIYKEEQLK